MELLDYFFSNLSRTPEDAWTLFEVKATLWALLCWAVSYWIAKRSRKVQHVQQMREEARNIAIATLMSCGIVFLFLLLIYSPYQQYKQLFLSSTTTQNELIETQGNMKKLEAENKALTTANMSLTDDKQQLEKSINDLRAQAERAQGDKEKRAASIAKLCFNEPLRFKQTRIKASSPDPNLLYAKQIELWMRIGPSETGRIKVYADDSFSSSAQPRDVIRPMVAGGNYAEYDVPPPISQRASIIFTLYGQAPFNVECIDKLPPRIMN